MRIEYIAEVVKWRDKINGNAYHSVRITRCADGAAIYCPFQYGSGYEYTAQEAMLNAGWIPAKYKDKVHLYNRENDYCIYWSLRSGLKSECIANGKA